MRAVSRMKASREARPLLRVGERCRAKADVGDVVRFGGKDFRGGAARIDAQGHKISPETIAESLTAWKCSLSRLPCGTIQTSDWQPCSRCSSAFHSSGNAGSLRPRSIRYW